jgi:hypothetical protein
VKTVREENGERDTRAINLELIRTTPAQLREAMLLKKAREARVAEGRVVEEAANGTAAGVGSEPTDPDDKVDPDDTAGLERERPWWEEARARKERERESLAGKEGTVARSISNRGLSEA